MRDSISFRPITDADADFLLRLYASTREQEMALVPWSEEEKAAFLAMQFHAQKQHYEKVFDTAEFLVIMRDGVDIGRLYIDRGPKEIQLLDIAFVPECRGQGMGTILMREILEEGRKANLPVTIYVEHFNPARHLYDRLGFRHIDTNGVYHLMEWRADESSAAASAN